MISDPEPKPICSTCARGPKQPNQNAPACPTPDRQILNEGCPRWKLLVTPHSALRTPHLEILTKDQAARVDRIKAYHAASQRAFGDQMGYAFLCGLELNTAKGELAHGQFTDWRKAHLPELPERSAQRYMAFSEEISKSATVADLPMVGNTRLLTNGELPEKERQKILDVVHEIADGKTLTQLYRDLGIIRDKKQKTYHAPKPLSPDEELAARKAAADDLAKSWLGATATLMAEHWPNLTPARQQEIEECRLELGAFIKSHSPKPAKKK